MSRDQQLMPFKMAEREWLGAGSTVLEVICQT